MKKSVNRCMHENGVRKQLIFEQCQGHWRNSNKIFPQGKARMLIMFLGTDLPTKLLLYKVFLISSQPHSSYSLVNLRWSRLAHVQPSSLEKSTENPGLYPSNPFSTQLSSMQWPTPQILAATSTPKLNLCLLSSAEPLCAPLRLHFFIVLFWNHF